MKTFFHVFYLSFFQFLSFFRLGFSSSASCGMLNFLLHWFLKKRCDISWDLFFQIFVSLRSDRFAVKCFDYETFINWENEVVLVPFLLGISIVCNRMTCITSFLVVWNLQISCKCSFFAGASDMTRVAGNRLKLQLIVFDNAATCVSALNVLTVAEFTTSYSKPQYLGPT